MRYGKWKLHIPRRGAVELYDLSVDPSESENVAERHPEVLADLTARIRNWAAELPDSYDK